MSTSIINGLKVNIEKSNTLNHDLCLIEVSDSGSSFHAYCKLFMDGPTPKAETLSSDAPGDANHMDAWLMSLSRADLRKIVDAAHV